MILRPIRALDAFIQRHFDSAVHAVMRRTGVTKRTLRRNGWGYLLAAEVATGFEGHQRLGNSLLTFGLVTLVVVLAVGSIMRAEDDYDAAAESAPGTASRADASGRFYKFMACYGLVWSLLDVWRDVYAGAALDVARALGWGFLGYLANTPPQAPKKKEERESAPLAAAVQV